jgi:hypothetical protein
MRSRVFYMLVGAACYAAFADAVAWLLERSERKHGPRPMQDLEDIEVVES